MASHHFCLLKALEKNAHKIRQFPVSVELLDKAINAPFDRKLDYAERFETQLLDLVRKKLTLEYMQSMPPREARDLESGLGCLFDHLSSFLNTRLQAGRSQSRSGASGTRPLNEFIDLMRLVEVLDDAQDPIDLCGEDGHCLFKFDTIIDARTAHLFAQEVNRILNKVHMTTATHHDLSKPIKTPQDGDIVDTWIQTFGRTSSERLGKVLDTVEAQFRVCKRGDTAHELKLLVSSYDNQYWEAQEGPNMILWCPEANKWQLGRCDIGSGLPANGMRTPLCDEIRETLGSNEGLAVIFYEDSDSFAPSSKAVYLTHERSLTSLKGLIEDDFHFRLPIFPHCFGREQRRTLAAKLALHLSVFCPWWKHASAAWDDNAVHFLELEPGKIDRGSPFIAWKLGDKQFHDDEEADVGVLAGFFTSFAKLLLEIEYGPISKMRIPNYDPDNGNLARSLEKICLGFLEIADPITMRPYLEAVRACLHLHKRYKVERLGTGVPERPQDTYQRLVRSEITSRILIGLPDFNILSNTSDDSGDDTADDGDYRYGSDSEPDDADNVPRYRDDPGDSMVVGVPLTEQLVGSGSNYTNIPQIIEPSLHDNIESVIQSLSDSEDGHLFDQETEPNSPQAQQRATDKWFKNFIEVLKGLRLGETSAKPLKVAILDSGVNLQNSEFNADERDRIKDTKSFVDDETIVEEADHGTFVATILLRLSVNVDLYIAKITKTNKPDVKAVVKALEYARTEWKVDMVSLSFGFDHPNPSNGLHTEIKNCLRENIAVFASASNDGAEGSRTYPAKFQEVICVHSSDQHGKSSDFNPTPRPQVDLSFIGENIRPIWGRTDLKHTSEMVYRRGTSYATPVAVAFAACMIGYIHENSWEDWQWVHAPLSTEGMMRILRMMSKHTEVYRWVSPTSFFECYDRETIKILLKQSLVRDNMDFAIRMAFP